MSYTAQVPLKDRQARYREIVKLKEQGLSNVAIGRKLNITGQRVCQVLKLMEANSENI